MTNFDTYAVVCPSAHAVLHGNAAFIGTASFGGGKHAFGFGPALFAGTDARMEKTVKAAAMLPARPWEDAPPREVSRL